MPAPWKGKSSDESAEPGKKIKTDRIDLETCHFEVELRFHRTIRKLSERGRLLMLFSALRWCSRYWIIRHQQGLTSAPRKDILLLVLIIITISELSALISVQSFVQSYRLIRALVITGGLQGLAAHSRNLMIQWIFRFPTLNKTNGEQVVWIPWLWNIWTTFRKRLQRIFYPCLHPHLIHDEIA